MSARGLTTLDAFLEPVRDVLNRRQFPEKPISDPQIEMLLRLLASMDSDKDPAAARVGEREGRIASPLLGQLSAGFNHGVGRSGRLEGAQPKAVGASLMQQVADTVAVDAIRKLGLPNARHGLVVPLSTGMTIGLILSAFRRELGIRRVLWPRVDHLSPKKAISLAGLEEVLTPTVLSGDAVRADIDALARQVRSVSDSAVLATTTFFPPREMDPIRDIAKLCGENNVPLIINNAYGVQSERIMSSLKSAIDTGRVDAVVQSSDKNFLAPVGASIVVSSREKTIDSIAETYAGRASAAPIVQTLAALLATGHAGYLRLRNEQVVNRKYLESRLAEIAHEFKQRLLEVENAVACAMTIDDLGGRDLGARLYNRRVTGPRVVLKGESGASIDGYPHDYIVMNAAIGSSREDVEMATNKLHKELMGES